jgi:hypothetical protein
MIFRLWVSVIYIRPTENVRNIKPQGRSLAGDPQPVGKVNGHSLLWPAASVLVDG